MKAEKIETLRKRYPWYFDPSVATLPDGWFNAVDHFLSKLKEIGDDLAPKFYPVLSSLRRFWVAVFGAVAAGCGAEPFRLRSTASRRGLIV